MGRRNKKKKTRIRCPKCSSKRITLLNKAKELWECLNKQCGQKFLYYPDLNRFMTLDGKDFAIVDKMEAEIPITGKLSAPTDEEPKVEDKPKVISKATEESPEKGLDGMLKNFGF